MANGKDYVLKTLRVDTKCQMENNLTTNPIFDGNFQVPNIKLN